MRTHQRHVEDAPEFTGRYTVKGWRGVAFWVDGWVTEPDEDTEWSGYENRTGQLAVVMVGDDRRQIVDPDDLEELSEREYCHSCGQIGCTHNIPDDEEDE